MFNSRSIYLLIKRPYARACPVLRVFTQPSTMGLNEYVEGMMKICIAMETKNLVIPLIKRGMISDYDNNKYNLD